MMVCAGQRWRLCCSIRLGILAAVYGMADVAFVGGSLVERGGHNPLEPAQFGVPVVMGPSFENFRDVVGKMIAEDGIRIVQDKEELEVALVELLTDRETARAMGERGRWVFEEQQGATARAVEALVGMVTAMRARRVWAWPLVPIYAAALVVRDGLRRMGVLRVRRLQWPVISVGSLSAGGAGKTPVVIALAELLQRARMGGGCVVAGIWARRVRGGAGRSGCGGCGGAVWR